MEGDDGWICVATPKSRGASIAVYVNYAGQKQTYGTNRSRTLLANDHHAVVSLGDVRYAALRMLKTFIHLRAGGDLKQITHPPRYHVFFTA